MEGLTGLKKGVGILGGMVFRSVRQELAKKFRERGLSVRIIQAEDVNDCIIKIQNPKEGDEETVRRILMEFKNASS